MKNNRSNLTLERLLGNEAHFPLSQQMFHAITFCGALIALLMSVSDLVLGLGPAYYLYSLSIAVLLGLLYALSRYDKQPYHTLVHIYGAAAAFTMIYVWKMLGGFSGAINLITLAIFVSLAMISSGRARKVVLPIFILLFTLLFIFETVYPEWVVQDADRSAVLSDLFVTTLILGSGCFMGIAFMMRNEHNQKEKLKHRTEDLEQAIRQINELNQLLPICCHCRKIRNDEGYWLQIEHYFQEHGNATFTHGLCPECGKELYGEYYRQEKDDEAG